MTLNFPTRSAARLFKSKREAHGFQTKLIDAGKGAAKRYSCDIKKVK